MENVARVWELGGWGMLLWDGRSVPAGSRTEEGADGRYPSLLMRALGLRLVPSSPHLAKLVSYEYMNRQLVWNAFTVSYSLTRFVALADEIGIRNVRFPPTTTLTILFPTFLSRPRTIDYSSIAPLPTLESEKTTAAHSGQLADLPLDTCPICHLRSTSTPVPLTSSVDISLPPVGPGESKESNEENRIFVPAQTDCWGGCRWCYYCIMGELVSQEHPGTGVEKEEPGKWDCLRCGGRVTRAWRVGPDPSQPSVEVDMEEKSVQEL
jgi:peroxin-2